MPPDERHAKNGGVDMKGKKSSKKAPSTVSIAAYDAAQPAREAPICRRLRAEIERALPGATSKVWHGAPVWFVGDTPVVGYSVPARGGVALLFWNGQAFRDPAMKPVGKFKAAQVLFEDSSEIKVAPLRRWLEKAETQLWDISSVRGERGRARNAPLAKKVEPAASEARPVKLLAGGNPQIAKADGDAPVQAYIAAMPGWKRDVGRRLDALVVRAVPGVRKAVRWNSPFYGVEGQGWFLNFHCFTKYVKVAFFRGTSLRPVPPGHSKHEEVRYVDIHGDDLDEAQMEAWIRQAAALPGWVP